MYCKLKIHDYEVSSEGVVIFSPDSMSGASYAAYLCGRVVEGGRVVSCDEAEELL